MLRLALAAPADRPLHILCLGAHSDDIEIGANMVDNRGKSEFDNPFGRFDMTTLGSVQQQPYSDFNVSSVSST